MGNTQRRLNVVLAVDAGGMDAGIKAGLAKTRQYADETKRIDAEIAANQRRLAEMTRAAKADPADTGKRLVAQRAAEQLNELWAKKNVAASLAEMEAKALAEEQAARAALEGELAIKRQESAMQGMTRETKAAERAIHENAGGLETMAGTAVRMGTILAAARLATEGMHIASAALEGDWAKAADAFRRIPVIGPMAEAGGGLAKAVHQKLSGTGADWEKGIDEANAARKRMADVQAENEKQAAEARLSDDQQFQERWNAERLKAVKERDALTKNGRISPSDEAAYQTALAAIDKKFGDEQQRRWQARYKAGSDVKAAAEEAVSRRNAEVDAANQAQEENAAREGWDAKMRADEQIAAERERERLANQAQEDNAAREGWDAKTRADEELEREKQRTDEQKARDREKLADWSKGQLGAADPMRQYEEFRRKAQAAIYSGDMTQAQAERALKGEIDRLTGAGMPQGGQFMGGEDYSRYIQSALMQKPDVSEKILGELEKLNRIGLKLAG